MILYEFSFNVFRVLLALPCSRNPSSIWLWLRFTRKALKGYEGTEGEDIVPIVPSVQYVPAEFLRFMRASQCLAPTPEPNVGGVHVLLWFVISD